MLNGYDHATAATGVGGELGEVWEPHRSLGGGAAELPDPEPAEESQREASLCLRERARESRAEA